MAYYGTIIEASYSVFLFSYVGFCGIIVVMIEKVVCKYDLASFDEDVENLKYWLSRPPAERVAAVDFPRKQLYGDSIRLQRTVRVVKLNQTE